MRCVPMLSALDELPHRPRRVLVAGTSASAADCTGKFYGTATSNHRCGPCSPSGNTSCAGLGPHITRLLRGSPRCNNAPTWSSLLSAIDGP